MRSSSFIFLFFPAILWRKKLFEIEILPVLLFLRARFNFEDKKSATVTQRIRRYECEPCEWD